MINLLPSDIRQNYIYARRNTSLLKWSLLFILSIAGVGIIVAGGLFYINRSINDYSSQNAKTQQSLKDQKIDDVQKQVQDISGSLKLVVQVLSKEVLFSKLITRIGAVMPNKATLTSLNISKTQGAIDLTAATKDYNTATQVLINLQDPANKIFDKADLIGTTCGSSAPSNIAYPCTVTIRAQFAKNNPFLFISPTGSTKP